jgi:hypothetical protein
LDELVGRIEKIKAKLTGKGDIGSLVDVLQDLDKQKEELKANLDEARRIAEADPMVRGGFETYELVPWKQATHRNNYLPKLEQR